jgi:NADPH:quinone reductase-like Zn-dependent oxidoreductase
MRKVVVHRPGGFNQLKIESYPDPSPEGNQVVVETKAIGVNYADCVVRMGFYASQKKYIGWPVTPGFDFSGIVVKKGKDVSKVKEGDEVFGACFFNAYATHVTSPQDWIFPIPDHISFEEAGGFMTIFCTAYYALHLSTIIFPSSTILVHSAAGGVGSALLQLCKKAGWRTIGVVGSASKVEAAKDMGANVVIDKSQEDLWKAVRTHAPKGCDVILDGNGVSTLRGSYQALKPTGKLISYGFHSMFPRKKGNPNYYRLMMNYFRTPKFNPVDMHKKNKNLITFNLSFLFKRKDLRDMAMNDLFSWLNERQIRMPKITTYPFEEVAQAHKDIQSGQTVGKLVLVP